MPWDPASGQTFGEYVRSKRIQTRPQGWTWATRDQVREGRDRHGRRYKHTTDQLGNEVRQYGSDQQDVTVRPRIVKGRLGGSPPANNDAQGG